MVSNNMSLDLILCLMVFLEYKTKVISEIPAQMIDPSAETDENSCIDIGNKATRKMAFFITGVYFIQKYNMIIQKTILSRRLRYIIGIKGRCNIFPIHMPMV